MSDYFKARNKPIMQKRLPERDLPQHHPTFGADEGSGCDAAQRRGDEADGPHAGRQIHAPHWRRRNEKAFPLSWPFGGLGAEVQRHLIGDSLVVRVCRSPFRNPVVGVDLGQYGEPACGLARQ